MRIMQIYIGDHMLKVGTGFSIFSCPCRYFIVDTGIHSNTTHTNDTYKLGLQTIFAVLVPYKIRVSVQRLYNHELVISLRALHSTGS